MKRKSLDVQKEIYLAIKENSGISMTSLERKIRTNPTSLREHCEQLAYFKLVRIEKLGNTTKIHII